MTEQQVTAALSDILLSPPKLPNFPLPRELRDQIYSYLLDGECVRIKRTWSRKEYEGNFSNNRSGPRAYHFHTNILGVNRAIHDEAEELLYKRNTFVVFSYAYSGLGYENGGLFWLPIVSNKHAPRMKHHPLMCTLRDTKYRQIDAATQHQILAPMAQILAPSQRVSLKGIVCDSPEVEHLKRIMSPTLNRCGGFLGKL